MSDLISRTEAIKAICRACGTEEPCDGCAEIDAVKGLPPSEAPKPTGDLIRRADAIEAVKKLIEEPRQYYTQYNNGIEHSVNALSALPSAEATCETCADRAVCIMADDGRWVACKDYRPSADAEDRLYIKIYADDAPSVMAEKLYQICGETQNKEVTEWLKEYFPSAEAVQGEWIYGTDPITGEKDCKAWTCSLCGGKYPWQPNFCPNCGSKMTKGGDTE